jgi:hypothetical protein
MKKHLLTTAAMLLGLAALAAPAAADITVTGYYDKDVTITIDETLTKTKTVTITVSRAFTGETAAEATGVHNQRVNDTVYRRDCAGCPTSIVLPPGPSTLGANILNSFNDNTGLVLWNQDVGVFSNQANIITAAVNGGSAYFAEAQDAAEQRTENNSAFVTGFVVAPADPSQAPTMSAAISGSVNNNTGVVMLNQNAGVASNQYNSLTLAFGLDGSTVALAEADLGQWNTGNHTFSVNAIRTATITGSINNNTGVTAVNQNAGNFNNQATKISVSGGL